MFMEKKDITPKSNKNNLWKKFCVGLAGGLLGGVLMVGGTYAAINTNLLPSPSGSSANTTNTTAKGETKVSNVSYDVSSDVTKAVKKVQNSVVS
ncbi:S1C family serine protease, partial [Enterococcus faecalis]